VDAGSPPTPGTAEDGVHAVLLEPPLPPTDGADGAEQGGADRHPRVAGAQEQQDVGAEPDLGLDRMAVVVEECPAFRRGELDTGQGSGPRPGGNAKKFRPMAKYQNRNPRRCSTRVEHAGAREGLVGQTTTDMVRDLGGAARLQAALALPDARLLERFALRRDEGAFEVLLHRHGPLVLGVCRQVLRDAHDAEDAFQATFLVLARRAGNINRPEQLGNWLYGVALRIADRARKYAARRRAVERDGPDLTAVAARGCAVEPDLAPVLHEEVRRLPDKYRGPVVLCYLEGLTNEEAADRLGWPLGTVKTRLDKARGLLRARLCRRGVALTAALLGTGVAAQAVPPVLLTETTRAALHLAAGVATVGASAQALSLSTGVLRSMALNKLKLVAAALLAAAVAGGIGYFAAAQDRKPDKPKGDKDAIVGTWVVEKVEVDGMDASDTEEGKGFRSKPLTISGDKIVMEGRLEMSYKLDPAAQPKAIDLDNGGGKTFDGVYSLDGDTLKICAPVTPGGPRPTEVGTKEGSDRRLVVLKRKAKDKE
jgi:RNA polymerase sigma factor (sigma-70 family)